MKNKRPRLAAESGKHIINGRTLLSALGVSLLPTLISGCGKPPEQEVRDADIAIRAARSIKADLYCGQTIDSALALFEFAVAQIDHERRMPIPFLRSYKRARKNLHLVRCTRNRYTFLNFSDFFHDTVY